MLQLRPYQECDAVEVGRLIAETFRKFNLAYASSEEQERLLGPFRHAGSDREEHRDAIANIIKATWVLVAEQDGEIVGVLRGSPGRLHSLFVREDRHRNGIGRMLMRELERMSRDKGADTLTMQSSLYAVPFYKSLGYKTDGAVQYGDCFDGADFPYQPMRKDLRPRAV